MRIKKSKRVELRARHGRWVQYCEDVKAGRARRRPVSGTLAAIFAVAALGLGGGVRC